MSNYEWLEKLPPEFIELVQQLMVLPMAMGKYIEETRRLEAEVLVLGNILLKKGIITKQEIETMTNAIFADKKKEMDEKLKSKPEILNRKDYIELKNELDKIGRKNGTNEEIH